MRVPVRWRDRREERGAVAVVVAVLMVVLLVISAFTVDFGMAYLTKRQLSSASDAASLAADAVYKIEYKGVCSSTNDPANPTVDNAAVKAHAEAAADKIFTENYPKGTASDGTITDVSCNGAGIQVTYSGTGKSESPFGVLAGGSGTITTAGEARAGYTVGTGICALCAIGDVAPGNADLTVSGGDIYVMGNVNVGPNSTWTATNSITITDTSNLSQAKANPDWTTGGPITDPLAGVTLPAAPYAGLTTKAAGASPCTGGPGIYTSYTIKNETCTLAAGAYVFKGALSFQNTNSHLTSNNQPVTLFFAGPSGMLDIKNGDINKLTAPSTPPLAGWPAGFAIIYSRDNTNNLELQGNGDSFPDVVGTVYAIKAKVAFNGNSCFQVSQGPIVVGGITGNGNKGCVTLSNTANAGAGTPTGMHLTK